MINYEVPYDFVLQYLYPVRPQIRKFLKGYALFYEKKILMYLRDRDTEPEYNGIYLATKPEYFDELEKAIHSSKMEFDLDGAPFTWLFISEDLPEFNDKVKKACELVKAGDHRIGK